MKKLLKITFLVFIYILPCSGQITFKSIFTGTRTTGINTIPFDSGYVLYDYDYISALVYIDSNGVINWSKRLGANKPWSGPGGLGSKSNFLIYNDNIIAPCFANDTVNPSFGIASYNIPGKSVNWYHRLILNDSIISGPNFPITMNYGIDKSFQVSTYRKSYQNSPRFPVTVAVDSLGFVKNSYLIDNHTGVAIFTHQVSANTYLSGLNFEGDTIGATLVLFDTTGQVKWSKTFFSRKCIFHSSVNNGDGTITIIGSPDSSNNGTYRAQNFLMRVDTSGNVIWCKFLGDTMISFIRYIPSQVRHTVDGGYVITAGVCDSTSSLYDGSDLIIIKTDSNGDTLWTRTHGNKYTEDWGYDINQTADGGYIVSGCSNSAQFPGGIFGGAYYIIKTDSLGMTDTHCQEFNLPIAVSNVVPPDSAITLTITTGLISSVPSSVYDTTYTIQQKNGCWLSAVGVEEAPSLQANPYTAIPNPSHGIFTLMGNGKFSGLKTFIGIDILGHELFKSQSNSQDPSFDLSSYPSGIYFIKIIANGRVDVVKIVLQK